MREGEKRPGEGTSKMQHERIHKCDDCNAWCKKTDTTGKPSTSPQDTEPQDGWMDWNGKDGCRMDELDAKEFWNK